jgi:beta-mannosidase
VIPHLPRIEASPTHLWFGWRRGSERDLAAFAARLPSQVRWVAEMGAQSIADNTEVTDLVDWPRPEPGRLAHRLGYEESSFDRYVPPTGHLSLDSWVEASQIYQAGLLRRQIETLRRLKYSPNGGFCVHFLADSGPAISASLVDHERRPKLAYEAVAEACAPVIVVADRLPVNVRPGEAVALDVHVVSDLRERLGDCVVEARLTWPGGSHRWRFGGAVAADSVTRVGTLSWMVPDSPGLATLHLELSGSAEASNRYDTTIRSPGERPVLRQARPS